MKVHKTAKGTELPILNLRGKDYLEVKYRIVWFTEEHPTWSIETEYVQTTDKSALAKATIRDDKGRVMATSHKAEDAKGFQDFLEKAETGAIGRALALLGFGTQFCGDELDEGGRIVDSPVFRSNGGIHPEQPGPNDGNQVPNGYYIPFGKFKQKTLEQVGVRDLAGYVDYLETQSIKKNQPITGQVKDFIERASEFIGAFENA